jgi:uncharacterized membrane protein YuzA (DUF378 family)
MDTTKRVSMVLLSLGTAFAGLLLMSGFFGFNLLDFAGDSSPLVRALLGVLVLGNGLICFWLFLKVKMPEWISV